MVHLKSVQDEEESLGLTGLALIVPWRSLCLSLLGPGEIGEIWEIPWKNPINTPKIMGNSWNIFGKSMETFKNHRERKKSISPDEQLGDNQGMNP
jgi:hypothetical protein